MVNSGSSANLLAFHCLTNPYRKKRLKRGDEVITSGGVFGKIEKVHDDDKIDLSISESVTIQVVKSTIQSLANISNTKK